ncbi:flagellar basal body-associated FliL family protein [Sulfurimonas sp. MAG313]|nr:flagellar basal body-associated FliL family protein [Sulfurimonas sp. MAG313]MDF1880276.1 flagellar basal body-associated FliL family protein [Sulfurimonas sp. MAG313]
MKNFGYNYKMNKNKIRSYTVFAIVTIMFIVLVVYAFTNSNFNFRGDVLKQKQKVGMGYIRTGRVEFKAKNIFFLGDFTTNMATHDRAGKFVRVEVRLKMSDMDLADELKDKNIVLRDAVIEAMSLKRFSEVATEKRETCLKRRNTIKA